MVLPFPSSHWPNPAPSCAGETSAEGFAGKMLSLFPPRVPYTRRFFGAEGGLSSPCPAPASQPRRCRIPIPAPGEAIWKPEDQGASVGPAAVGDADKDASPRCLGQGSGQAAASPARLLRTPQFFREMTRPGALGVPPLPNSTLGAAFPRSIPHRVPAGALLGDLLPSFPPSPLPLAKGGGVWGVKATPYRCFSARPGSGGGAQPGTRCLWAAFSFIEIISRLSSSPSGSLGAVFLHLGTFPSGTVALGTRSVLGPLRPRLLGRTRGVSWWAAGRAEPRPHDPRFISVGLFVPQKKR